MEYRTIGRYIGLAEKFIWMFVTCHRKTYMHVYVYDVDQVRHMSYTCVCMYMYMILDQVRHIYVHVCI